MSSAYEEMENVNWLRQQGCEEGLARDLVQRDRRKTYRELKQLSSIMQAWKKAGGAAELMRRS